MNRQNNILQQVVRGIKDMCYIWVKEMRTSITDQGLFIFFILVPLVYPLIYAWIYNNEVVRDVPIAVVDMSKSALSKKPRILLGNNKCTASFSSPKTLPKTSTGASRHKSAFTAT